MGVIEAELTGGRVPDGCTRSPEPWARKICLELQDGLAWVTAVTDEVLDGAAPGGDDRGPERLGGVEHFVVADGEIGGHQGERHDRASEGSWTCPVGHGPTAGPGSRVSHRGRPLLSRR